MSRDELGRKVARAIDARRKALKISQEDVAKAMGRGWTQQKLSQMIGAKANRSNYPIGPMDAAARRVGTTLAGVLAEEAPPLQISDEALRLALAVDALDARSRATILRQVEGLLKGLPPPTRPS